MTHPPVLTAIVSASPSPIPAANGTRSTGGRLPSRCPTASAKRGRISPANVWDENADPYSKTVQVTVGRLRRKLGQPDIETAPGAGYRITDQPSG